MKEALPFAIAIAVASTYFRVAVILVSLLLTAEETGYFAASYRVIEVLVVIPQLAIGAAFPILARAAGSDSERFAYGVRRLFEASLLFGAWVALCLVLGASLAIEIIAGPDFDPAATILRIQGLAMLASFIAVLWSYALLGSAPARRSARDDRRPARSHDCPDGRPGGRVRDKGAAVATVIGELTMAVVGAILLARAAGFVPVSAASFVRVAVAAVAGAAVALIPGIPVVLDLVLATVVYFAVLLALNGIPKELLVELRRLEALRSADYPFLVVRSAGEEPDIPPHDRQPGKRPEDGRAALCTGVAGDDPRSRKHRLVADVLHLEAMIGEEEPEALARERTAVGVVVPDPALGVRRRREDSPAGAQHASTSCTTATGSRTCSRTSLRITPSKEASSKGSGSSTSA